MSRPIKIIIKNSTVIFNKNRKIIYPNTKKQQNTLKKTREIYKTKVPQSLYEDDDDYQEILEKIIRNGGL